MGIVVNTGTAVQLWTNQYLADLATEAEIQISTEVNAIYVRFPLNVVQGQSVYDFQIDTPVPQRLTGVIRVTYQSWTVHPVFQAELRNNVIPLAPWNGDIISSRPFMYMRLGYGIDGIKLFPAPALSIPYDSTDITTQTGIQNNVIVSGWRIADPTGNVYRLPDYIRETLVRYYVMARAYKKEGKGQNLDASKYFEQKYQKLLGRFKAIVSNLFASRTKSVQDPSFNRYGFRPPRPKLPVNFGEPINPYGDF